MSADDVMMGLVWAGIAATAVQFGLEYVRWRRFRTADQQREMTARELHAGRLMQQADDSPTMVEASVTSVVNRDNATPCANSDSNRCPSKGKIAA